MTKKPSLTPIKNSASTRTLILRGFSFVFLLIAMVSGFLFYREYQVYRQEESAYASIADTVIMGKGSTGSSDPVSQSVSQTQAAFTAAESAGQTVQANGSGSNGPTATPSPEQVDYQRIRKVIGINFDRLSGINPDAVGWISSENSKINYPLVQGRDNAYYLNHLVSNEVNRLGFIFVVYRNKRDFSDEHTLIFGHNMNDGSMFNDLERYKDPAYYKDHKTIYLLTKAKYFRVDIFAGYLTTPQKIGQIYFNFDTQEAKERYISEAIRLSNFKSDVVLSKEDKIVSFFTCDYATEDSRFVVIGKLVPLNP
jgi:sortase B